MTIQEYLISRGFKESKSSIFCENLTIGVGRKRYVSVSAVGTPNEMVFIYEMLYDSDTDIGEMICLHNYDYDGYLTQEKIDLLLRFFGIPTELV
jgi:hypothetical protein